MSLLLSLKSLKIPVDWNLIPVGKVLQDTQYGTNAPTVKSGSISIVGMKDIQGGRILTDNLTKTELPENEKLKFLLRKGDLLINRTNSYDLVGKVGIFYSDKEAVFASYLVRLITDRDQVDPEYLNYWLNSYKAQVTIKKIATRAISQANINPTEFKKYCLVPLPPLPEQTAIADLLSTWDVAIKKIGQLVTAKQKQRKGLMRQLLSGKRRFPGYIQSQRRIEVRWGSYPVDWGYLRIDDIAEQVSCKNTDGAKLPVLSCTKHHGLVDSLKYFGKQVFSKDLSTYKIVRRNQFAYATNHIEEGSIGYQNLHDEALISPMYTAFETDDRINDQFLYLLLKTELYRHIFEANTSSSVDRRGSLRWKEFSKIYIPLPSIHEQEAIVSICDFCDREIDLLQQQLEAVKEQRKGLMQLLLTGKARVKPENEAVV